MAQSVVRHLDAMLGQIQLNEAICTWQGWAHYRFRPPHARAALTPTNSQDIRGNVLILVAAESRSVSSDAEPCCRGLEVKVTYLPLAADRRGRGSKQQQEVSVHARSGSTCSIGILTRLRQSQQAS